MNQNFAKAFPVNSIKTNQIKNDLHFPITDVYKLSDLSSNSWEFQSLKSLNNRYQCLDKSDNSLKKSPEVITSYQFTILLNQCFHNFEKKFSQVTSQDMAIIQRLQDDFNLEFTEIKTKIEELETRVNLLETQSFAPKIKLEGEAIIALAGVANNKNDNNLTLGSRLRLSLETSFTEKDKLQIRLQGRNIPEFEEITGTKMANLGFDGDDDNEIEIDELEYKFSLSRNTEIALYAVGGGLGDLIPTVNPLFSGSGDGSISTFGRENPIRRQAEGAAISISHDFAKKLNFTLGYVSNDANEADEGLLQTPYGAIAQLTFNSDRVFNFSLTYGYTTNNVGTGTGSALAEQPFNNSNNINSHSYGAEASLLLTPNLSLGSRVGWIQAYAQDLPDNPKADIFTWAILLGITDLGKEDSLLGFVVGQPPKVINHDLGKEFEDGNTAYHLEVFYRFPITDEISITPGFWLITNPEHNSNNDSIWIGAIRTTLEF